MKTFAGLILLCLSSACLAQEISIVSAGLIQWGTLAIVLRSIRNIQTERQYGSAWRSTSVQKQAIHVNSLQAKHTIRLHATRMLYRGVWQGPSGPSPNERYFSGAIEYKRLFLWTMAKVTLRGSVAAEPVPVNSSSSHQIIIVSTTTPADPNPLTLILQIKKLAISKFST
ncbi:predicted protein [Plenodomus lingam JN3]|uniref:Predicted protein n=1 Tax=Leptosphaeria maculans (strain JN3 / isolate v23.1.3 / race Av1-4-5-6-7-8) TaxID=985895 RepID=E4ZS27_LEPMJ|nr:predicted protein [Plenodomus lingam JN3]CBX94207.1 predicted protein [Plenodomus lingam JN3]